MPLVSIRSCSSGACTLTVSSPAKAKARQQAVAAERGHAEFAQLMAASQQLVRVKSVPTPAAVALEGRLVYRSSAGSSVMCAKLSADGQLTLAAGGGVLEAGEGHST